MAQDKQNKQGEHEQHDEWLAIGAAAPYLGVSTVTLYRLVDDGLVVAYRPARSIQFRRSDLDAYLESVKVRPGDLVHLRSDHVGRSARRQLKSAQHEAT